MPSSCGDGCSLGLPCAKAKGPSRSGALPSYEYEEPMLAEQNCVPCRGGIPSLKGDKLTEIHRHLAEPAQGNIVNQHHLSPSFNSTDYRSALPFVDRHGELRVSSGAQIYT